MKRILVPTDFSEGAFNALVHALHIAQIFDAAVDVIHAYSIPPTGTAVMVDLTDILRKNALEEIELLKKRTSALNLAKGIKIDYDAEHGSVIDVIARSERERQIDLVVMGTQGASGITEKWLGTNTAAAARNTNVPMLAVPAESRFKPYSQIMFSTDFKVIKDKKSMEFAAKFAKAFDGHVRFLHVRKDGEKRDSGTEDAYKLQMKSIFGSPEPTFSFTIDSNIDSGIKETLGIKPADLLITVRHDYGFFEGLFRSSISQKIINSASIPILIIKG
jgi:nucleotide-binding universal stress UspA family protein